MNDTLLFTLVGLVLAALLVIYFCLLIFRYFLRTAPAEVVPEKAIIVDGSNVMHWGGEPSVLVLCRVIDALKNEGFTPYVCFDANVGYKLGAGYMGSRELSKILHLRRWQVHVVEKGVVADGVLLERAAEDTLTVVSNDRFRDWADRYTWVKEHRRFRRGRWADGNLVWGKR